MFGIYTKNQVENRMNEQFGVFLDYLETQDDLIESLEQEVYDMVEMFDKVMTKSGELLVALNSETTKKSIKKSVSKKSSKK